MHRDRATSTRRAPSWVAAGTAVLVAIGLSLLAFGLQAHDDFTSPTAVTAEPALFTTARPPLPKGDTAPATPTEGAGTTGVDAPDRPPLSRSRPVRLDIDSLNIHAPRLVDLGINADGTLQVPSDYDLPGWYSPGPAPGQFGPAVIAGHVDSKSGPAVFYRLHRLRIGATVRVTRTDGTQVRFLVDQMSTYAKSRFPTHLVYGSTTNRAELRIITCGGVFNRRTGHYQANTVAYAHMIS